MHLVSCGRVAVAVQLGSVARIVRGAHRAVAIAAGAKDGEVGHRDDPRHRRAVGRGGGQILAQPGELRLSAVVAARVVTIVQVHVERHEVHEPEVGAEVA
jgi:hypothetical protein